MKPLLCVGDLNWDVLAKPDHILLLGGDAGPDRTGLRPDSLSVVSINADTGATTTDSAINRAGTPAMVAGGAYSDSFAGARSTVLYDLDAASAVLADLKLI